ncbi:hypothetical protein Tco_0763258, partial [Tanacetum coccineum]
MHERPAGKIGLYTRFFYFGNFRLPLSTFLVNILRHFRINISQLSVIGAAKVSHFEIVCRVYGITPTVGLLRCFYVNSKKNGWMSFIKRSDKSLVCYMKPLDSLKNWNDHFFWVDDFVCPVHFPWHTVKNVTRDPAPAAADFNAQDYATLVAHPSSFRKFPEEFLCLVGLSRHYTLDEETYLSFLDKDGEDMDIFAFIHTPDPTKVKVAERERKKDEPRLLETTVGRIVPLLPVAPDRGERELDASVDKLFDKGGSVTETTDTVAEDVILLQPRRQKKRKTIVADVGGPLHPSKRLKGDHGTPSGAFVGGKSRSAVQRLLAGAVQNVEVKGEPIPTLPFLTSSVSATSEREDSSHHSGANIAEAEVDSFAMPFVPVIIASTTITSTVDPVVVVKEKIVKPSLFSVDSTSAGGTDLAMGGLRILLAWNVTNGSRLDDGGVCCEMVDEFAPPNAEAQMLLKEVEAAEAIRLRVEASNFETLEKSLRDEVNALNKRNTILKKERNALDVKVTDLEASV